MRILFVRHGQDDETCRGGWSRHGLTAEGKRQARCVARYLSREAGYHIREIHASDLNRAMETAACLGEALKLPVFPDPALREMNNGDLAGMPNDRALREYPGLFFNTLDMDTPYPNGESPADFFRRVQAWFQAFVSKNRSGDGDLVVVTHGGVIKIVYHLVKGWTWTNRVNTVPVEKCSIHILNTETMTFEAENRRVW